MTNRLSRITAGLLVVVVLMLGVLTWQLAGMASTLNAVHTDTRYACWATQPSVVPWDPQETPGPFPTLDMGKINPGPYCP